MNEDVLRQYAKENPRRDVAVVGLRDIQGNVLLMRSHKLPGHWQPIGGGVDPEDVSPRMAAVRELKEELGIKIDPSTLHEVLVTPYDFGEGSVYFFETPVNREKLELHVDSHEVIEHRWFSKDEAIVLSAMPATQKYLQQLT